jgi:hypothetical protein
MEEAVAKLEKHKEIDITDDVRDKLLIPTFDLKS